jgi:hypothetical protein
MSYLITKHDFPEFVPLSVNVADNLVNPYIRDAFTFEVSGLLTAAEWLLVQAALVPAQEPAEEAPAVVDYGQELWAALKPVWVLESFRRFLLWHGTHITSNGVETIANDGNQPVSSARRVELKADIEAKASHYRRLLEAVLRTYRGVPAATSCRPTYRRPSSGGLTTHAV